MPNAFLARQPIYDRTLEVFGKVDAELVEAARHLSGQGCTIALDYFQGYFFCVLTYDRGNWGEARYAERSTSEVTQTYLDAIAWAGQVAQALLVDNDPPPPTHR